jgi:hypothetical protein
MSMGEFSIAVEFGMCWGLVRENDRSWKVILLIIEVVSLIGLFVKGGFKTSRTLNL